MTQDGMSGGLPALIYNGAVIHERREMLSLTDMWRAAGSVESREPFNWLRFEGRAFVEAVALSHNLSDAQVMTKKVGKSGGTWAHWQIALGYAKYLDHGFHMWCNEVVRERMESSPARPEVSTLALDDAARRAIGGIVKAVMPALLAEAMQTILPAIVREQVGARNHAVVSGILATDVLAMAGVNQRTGLRGLSAWASNHLRRYHAAKKIPVHLGGIASVNRYLFDPLTCREWLADGGKEAIAQKVAERRGQGRLRLI